MKDTVEKDMELRFPSFFFRFSKVSFAASTAANTSIDQKDAAVEDSTAAQ